MLLTVTSKVTPFSFKRLTKDVSLNAYPGVKTPVNDKKNRYNRNLGWVRNTITESMVIGQITDLS